MKKWFLIGFLFYSLPCFPESTSETISSINNEEQCQFFKQGDQGLGCQCQVAYNYPARIQVEKEWDVGVQASFIYWYPYLQGLSIADSDNYVNRRIAAMHKFQWKPGFQVGANLNTNHDNWSLKANYIWLYGTTSSSFQTPNNNYESWDIYKWIIGPTSPATDSHLYSRWKFQFNMIDAFITRPYYEGRFLTIAPIFGLKGSWINQKLYIASGSAHASYTSKDWMIGPNIGILTNWLIGGGVRLQANIEGGLLYTRFTKLIGSSNSLINSTSSITTIWKTEMATLDFASPVFKTGLGIGWGTYFNENRMHFDFSASYDLLYLANQNLIPAYLFATYDRFGPIGSLFLQGLTLTMRFDF